MALFLLSANLGWTQGQFNSLLIRYLETIHQCSELPVTVRHDNIPQSFMFPSRLKILLLSLPQPTNNV